MKFSKETIKRGMAGGLIALMIASNVACDKKESSVNEWLDNQQIGNANVMDITGYEDENIPNNWAETIDGYYVDYSLNLQPLPIAFLKQLGVTEKRNNVDYFKDGFRGGGSTFAYADADSIHVILRLVYYSSDLPHSVTGYYHLQYNVTPSELQTFLSLDNDFRMRFFIQGLDETHKRNVVSKAVLDTSYAYGLSGLPMPGSQFHCISDIDYDAKTITVLTRARGDGLYQRIYQLDDAVAEQTPLGACLQYSSKTQISENTDDAAYTFVVTNGTQVGEVYTTTPNS